MDQSPRPAQPDTRFDYERVGMSNGRPEDPATTAPADEVRRPQRRRRKSLVREYVEAIAIAILLALVIRTLIVQAFTIPSGLDDGHAPGRRLHPGQQVPVRARAAADRLRGCPACAYPHRGDIIVFKYPQDEKRDFIKRIVATPGETVQVRGHQVLVNGRPLDGALRAGTTRGALATRRRPATAATPTAASRRVVPADSYFVMGDNRDNSQDAATGGS